MIQIVYVFVSWSFEEERIFITGGLKCHETFCAEACQWRLFENGQNIKPGSEAVVLWGRDQALMNFLLLEQRISREHCFRMDTLLRGLFI